MHLLTISSNKTKKKGVANGLGLINKRVRLHLIEYNRIQADLTTLL